MGAAPADIMHYRAANRMYDVARKLDPDGKIGGKNYRSALYNLMLYSEHTWGHSACVTQPYLPQVSNLDQREAAVCVKSQRIRGSGLREDTPKLWRDPRFPFIGKSNFVR